MATNPYKLDAPGHTPLQSDLSAHTPGTSRGENWVKKRGREPGRDNPDTDRTARDSTSINPELRGPIDPMMPHIPPA